LKKNSIDPEPVVSIEGYDFSGSVVYGDNKNLRVHFETDADDNT